jgi:hypothetical protein
MEVGVNPVPGAALVALRDFVRAVPIASAREPEGLQGEAEARRRGRIGERRSESGEIHGVRMP